MQEITIELSDTMKEFVDGRVAAGDYPSPADFICHLLREEQQRRGIDYLKAKIREADASGASEEITEEYWDEVRKTFRQKNGPAKVSP
jgi:putative addiction module CopG family antidote